MPSRRTLLTGSVATGLATLANAVTAQPISKPGSQNETPRLTLEFDILADIAANEDLGEGPLGHRRIVPIIGGTFQGPRANGKVRPGGADRQLIRTDGVKQLSALYELETHDGAVITVLNEVLVEQRPGGERYAYSVPNLTAPKGPYDWINHSVYVGTLDSLRPAREGVRVRIFRVG